MATTIQFGTTLRNALLQSVEDTIGTTPKLRYCTGSAPATCATAQSGTQLIEMTLPSDWQAAPSSGSSAKTGTWSGTTTAAGTAGYWRLLSSAGTCHAQGAISMAFKLTTSASSSAGSNILTFAATSGVVAGMGVYGTGIPTGATVLSLTSTTVTISAPSTAGVASSAGIYFGDTSGSLWLNNTALGASQAVTCDAFTLIAPGA